MSGHELRVLRMEQRERQIDNLKCKTTDLLQAMTCIAWK